jgi:hypothetical protein
MKTTITGFINHKDTSLTGCKPFSFHMSEMREYGYVTVMPYSIEVEIPDDFDPRPKQVEYLTAQKKELMAAFHLRVTEIERKISELSAITYEATA